MGNLYLPASFVTSSGQTAYTAVFANQGGNGPTLLQPDSTLFDAKMVTLAVSNAANQPITGLTLVSWDMVGGAPAQALYPISGVNVPAASAAGPGVALYTVVLSGGLLANLSVQATYTTAPAAGAKVAVRATIQGPGGPLNALAGSNATPGTSAAGLTAVFVAGRDGSNNLQNLEIVSGGLSDGTSGGYWALVQNESFGFNGATWDRMRASNGVPHYMRQASAVGGTPYAIWTPASGKRFRVLALMIAGSGVATVWDGSTAIYASRNWGWMQLPPNGVLSSAANNALQLSVDSTGEISAFAVGTEE